MDAQQAQVCLSSLSLPLTFLTFLMFFFLTGRFTYLATLCLSIGIGDLVKLLKVRAKAKEEWRWAQTALEQLLDARLGDDPATSPDILPLFRQLAKEGKLETWEEIASFLYPPRKRWKNKVNKKLGRSPYGDDSEKFETITNLESAVNVMAEQEIERVLLIQHYAPPPPPSSSKKGDDSREKL